MHIFVNCILTTLRENCFLIGWCDQPVVQRRILAIGTKNSTFNITSVTTTNDVILLRCGQIPESQVNCLLRRSWAVSSPPKCIATPVSYQDPLFPKFLKLIFQVHFLLVGDIIILISVTQKNIKFHQLQFGNKEINRTSIQHLPWATTVWQYAVPYFQEFYLKYISVWPD